MERTKKAADISRTFSDPTFAAGSRTLRYLTKKSYLGRTNQHLVALYLPAGEDIAGPHSVDAFDTVEEARQCWKEKAATMSLRGLHIEAS